MGTMIIHYVKEVNTELLLSGLHTNLQQRLVTLFPFLYQHSMLFQKCTQEQAEILYEVLLLITATFICIA